MSENLQKPDYIARLFGVSVRRIQQLTQEGVIHTVKDPKGGARKYDLIPTIQEYIKYLSDKAYGRAQTEKEGELKDEKLRVEIELKKSQSELHQLKTEIAKGSYISTEEVGEDYQRFFVLFKKFAMAIPARVGGYISGYIDPVVERGIEKDLQREINTMLRNFVVAGKTPPEDGAGK